MIPTTAPLFTHAHATPRPCQAATAHTRTRLSYSVAHSRLPPIIDGFSAVVFVFFTFGEHPERPVLRLLPIKLLDLARRVQPRQRHRSYTHGAGCVGGAGCTGAVIARNEKKSGQRLTFSRWLT